MPTISVGELQALRRRIWSGALPLEIRLAAADCATFDQSDPYLISYPRLAYLPCLLKRLHSFFRPYLIDPDVAPQDAWISFEGLPLKWHYPVGLLHDLFSGITPTGIDDHTASTGTLTASPADAASPLPWRLTVHYTSYPAELIFPLDAELRVLRDAFINSIKEADYVRHGSAKQVMSLSKQDSDSLWTAVETLDIGLYNTVNAKLLDPPGQALKHIPIKVYLPTSNAHPDAPRAEEPESQPGKDDGEGPPPQTGSVRVVQGLVAPLTNRQPTTLGVALNTLLPTVFPSRRNPVIAAPVLHGAVVPMNADLEDLSRAVAYADGWLHVGVTLLS